MGRAVGRLEGCGVGWVVGGLVGLRVGSDVGSGVGSDVGSGVGMSAAATSSVPSSAVRTSASWLPSSVTEGSSAGRAQRGLDQSGRLLSTCARQVSVAASKQAAASSHLFTTMPDV